MTPEIHCEDPAGHSAGDGCLQETPKHWYPGSNGHWPKELEHSRWRRPRTGPSVLLRAAEPAAVRRFLLCKPWRCPCFQPAPHLRPPCGQSIPARTLASSRACRQPHCSTCGRTKILTHCITPIITALTDFWFAAILYRSFICRYLSPMDLRTNSRR